MEEMNLIIRRIEPQTYELEIQGEDDSIGNLLATYLENLDEVQLSYYSRPHVLEDKIVVYVKLKKDIDIKKVIEKAIRQILEDIEDLKQKYLKALEKIGVSLEQ